MPETVEATCAVDIPCSLGESPLWSVEEQALYWVDINAPAIHRYHPASGGRRTWDMPCEVGCIAFADPGTLVAGLRTGFHRFALADGALTPIVDPEPDKPDNRCNDGKVDRAGRLWCGTMKDPDPGQPRSAAGALYRLDPDGTCTRMLDGIRVPNATAWSPDDARMYFADSREHTIRIYDFDLEAGSISNRRNFASTADRSGSPDGATVDADGYLWCAEYGGARVTRYRPDGVVDRVVRLPVSAVTCCAFGGAALRTLYITTARQRMSEADLAREPLAGSLFVVETDVSGLPEPRFGAA